MNKTTKTITNHSTHRRGVTLVELMVSVGILALLLLVVGVVFQTSGKASGKALATMDLMHEIRSATRQLESDIGGMQGELPIAIIFEAHKDDSDDNRRDWADPFHSDRFIRADRIVFFAEGNYQELDLNSNAEILGNLARIFYGQAEDDPKPPGGDEWTGPDRRILTRRCKIMADMNTNWWLEYATQTAVSFDSIPVSYYNQFVFGFVFGPNGPSATSKETWKNWPYLNLGNYPPGDFQNTFFRSEYVYSNDFNLANSWVRRVDLDAVDTLNLPGAIERLYWLNDVVDFRIQLWFEDDDARYGGRWFPDDQDFENQTGIDRHEFGKNPTGVLRRRFAFFWNVNNANYATPALEETLDTGLPAYETTWWSEQAMKNSTTLTGPPDLSWQNPWPKAIRFTFTLYDKNRRYFPEGKTISYILDWPSR